MTRYALYFTPRPGTAWWKAGCQWLGRDPFSGDEWAQPALPGLPHRLLAKLTSDPRRYGFHATLKAPFRLENGLTEAHLLAMADAFCACQRPLAIDPVEVTLLGSALVLKPSQPVPEIDALAQRCVSYFDLLRAPPKPDEQQKYRSRGLSARQDALMQRWGYPYTEDEFHCHLTLTDSLRNVDADAVDALRAAARAHFAKAREAGPLTLDGLTIFREDQPGLPFSAWKQVPFNRALPQASQPAAGKLFYFVAPAGAGREALLQWVREHMPDDGNLVFARRTITRPTQDSELHEPVDEATFWQLAHDGHFAMLWQADDLCYGIRRSIEVDLKTGRHVIVSGMPEYLPQLRQRFPDAQVIWPDAGSTQASAAAGELCIGNHGVAAARGPAGMLARPH